jgi:thiamine biosynthesis protein ThiI
MNDPILLLRLGELWLKGNNRGLFKQRLTRNLRSTLRSVAPGAELIAHHDRYFVRRLNPATLDAAYTACADVPGLARVIKAIPLAADLSAVGAVALELVRQRVGDKRPTFAVRSKRSDKRFPLRSPEINRSVAEAVLGTIELPVDLKRAELVVGVEIAEKEAYVWLDEAQAAGGLPVGTAGKALLLLSGGIDSPVAGWLAQKRGCSLEAIYFHSPPFIGPESRDKVADLGRRLAPRQGGKLNLHVVHFTEIQKAIRKRCEPRHTVLLYRRFMYRIADQLAENLGCQILATGENVGQVASQTLENIAMVDRLPRRWTLRPVITYDKREIMDLARRIGTYEISIQPFDDCCTLFVPKHPTIRTTTRVIEGQEQRLEVDALVEQAIASIEVLALEA